MDYNYIKKQQYKTIYEFISQEMNKNSYRSCHIAMELMPYSDALVKMIETKNLDNHLNEEVFNKIIIETIGHDYNGLMSNDEDFLPRLKENKKLSDLVNDLQNEK
jgi:hypothetical protein